MGCYQIKGYACTTADRINSVIAKDVSIRMGGATTIISIAEREKIPKTFFSFGNYATVQDMSTNRDRITDYIGILHSIENGKTKKNTKGFVNLNISDSSNEMLAITIWEEIAQQRERFPRPKLEKAAKPTVVAATSLRFNHYHRESLGLQSTAATHVYLAPEHPATAELLQSYNPLMIRQNKEQDVYVTEAEEITVTNLLMKEQALPYEKIFRCDAYISDFVTNTGWFYTGCSQCNGTAYKSDNIWFCTDCGDINEIKYKSRMVIFISDGFSAVKVTMFDDTLETLINKPIHDFVTKDGYDDNTALPPPVLKNKGKLMSFIVKPQRDQYPNAPKFILKRILMLEPDTKALTAQTSAATTPKKNEDDMLALTYMELLQTPSSTSVLDATAMQTPETVTPDTMTVQTPHTVTPDTDLMKTPGAAATTEDQIQEVLTVANAEVFETPQDSNAEVEIEQETPDQNIPSNDQATIDTKSKTKRKIEFGQHIGSPSISDTKRKRYPE